MTYLTPESRRPAVEAVLEAFARSRRVILTTHINADGDGAGSQAALVSLLQEMGCEAWIVNPTPFPETYRFLLPEGAAVLEATSEEAARRCREADLCVVVDTGEKNRIGRVKPMVDHLPLVVVDHHPPGEDALEGVALRDEAASAAGELVFDLIWTRGGPWTPTVAIGLYVAILTDTGSFRFSNATAGAHRVAAELIERGASPDELYRQIYAQAPLKRMRLLEQTLSTLEVSPEGRVAWMTVPTEVYRKMGCTSDDLDGLVDFPRGVVGVEVALLFREVEPDRIKVSLRSNGLVDVNVLAREMGGGGHVRASGALIRGRLEEVRDEVVMRSIEHASAALERSSGDEDSDEPGHGQGGAPASVREP